MKKNNLLILLIILGVMSFSLFVVLIINFFSGTDYLYILTSEEQKLLTAYDTDEDTFCSNACGRHCSSLGYKYKTSTPGEDMYNIPAFCLEPPEECCECICRG